MREFLRTAIRGTAIALFALALAWTGPVQADAAPKQGDKIESVHAGLVLIQRETANAQDMCGPDVMQGTLYREAYGPRGADFDHSTVLMFGYIEQTHPFAAYIYPGVQSEEDPIAVAVDDAQGTIDVVYDAPPFPSPCELAKP